jgi:hypothetical protein
VADAGELDDDEDAVTGGNTVARVERIAPKKPTQRGV